VNGGKFFGLAGALGGRVGGCTLQLEGGDGLDDLQFLFDSDDG